MLLFLFWEGQTLCDLKRRQLNNNRRRFGPEINEKEKSLEQLQLDALMDQYIGDVLSVKQECVREAACT